MDQVDGLRHTRRNLPHFQCVDAWFHVTVSLRLGITLSSEERDTVFDAFRFYDGKRWELGALAVLPTLGTHVLCRPLEVPGDSDRCFALSSILQSAKSYSARRINSMRGSRGPVWDREYFDRTIRSEKDFREVVRYIAYNRCKHGDGSAAGEDRWVYLHPDCWLLDWWK